MRGAAVVGADDADEIRGVRAGHITMIIIVSEECSVVDHPPPPARPPP